MISRNDSRARRAGGAGPSRVAWPITAALAVTLAVSACASTQGRLQRGLLEAGVPPDRSACMARHMTKRLSASQLRRLARVRHVDREPPKAEGLERFLANTQALGDPRIVDVASAAALGCAMVEP